MARGEKGVDIPKDVSDGSGYELEMVFKLGPGSKPRTIIATLSDSLSLEDMKKLWGVEQTLNSLPGCNLRAHINVRET